MKTFIKNKRGFSLLELIFTISLISILGLSVVSSSNTSDPTVQSAMLKVVSDIRFAQDRAIITGVNHGFRTISATQYEIYQLTPGNPVNDPSTSAPMQISLYQDYKNVNFARNYQVEFNSYGQPVLGGGLAVNLSKDSSSRTFTVTNNTGLIILP
ncbi:MAG: prepilin-type N-terminal cleavage/methylation domain-containing protein [Deltaproteobacteria bacterium]|nr:prepilin-type N-terminal cleavage/methylation domain-containing protein [Deltaproteobacteria bacterium]